CRRFPELIRDELTGERLTESRAARDPRDDIAALARRRFIAPLRYVLERLNLAFIQEPRHQTAHPFMKAAAACHHHADGNGAVRMQPFKILQVAVDERILVVPLDLERDPLAALEL